jgi:hypothetical protein
VVVVELGLVDVDVVFVEFVAFGLLNPHGSGASQTVSLENKCPETVWWLAKHLSPHLT